VPEARHIAANRFLSYHARRCAAWLVVSVVLALTLGWPATVCAGAGRVTVTVDAVPLPPDADPARTDQAAGSPAARADRTPPTTPRVRLENRYLIVDILPALGGGVHRLRYKPAGRPDGAEQTDRAEQANEPDEPVDLLAWGADRSDAGLTGQGGGFELNGSAMRGRVNMAAGFTVIHLPNGAKMIALDSRLPSDVGERAEPTETRGPAEPSNAAAAWPAAVPLRLGQFITLRPGEARLRWEAAVSNPLPIRAPMVLHHRLHPPSAAPLRWLRPAQEVVEGDKPSATMAGWFMPDSDVNLLRIADRAAAPGSRVTGPGLNGDGPAALISRNGDGGRDAGAGNHGSILLPAFGGYRMTLDHLPVAGIGRIDHATRDAAVNVERGPRGWVVRLWSANRLTGGTLTVTGGGRVYRQTVHAHPHRPAVIDTPLMADEIRVTLTGETGETLLRATLPGAFISDPPPEPRGDDSTRSDAARRDKPADDRGGDPFPPLSRDLAVLRDSAEPAALRASARRLLLADPAHPALDAGLSRLLKQRPDDPHGHLYRAIQHIERGQPEQAVAHLRRAADLPGAAFLLALHQVRAGRMERADALFRHVLEAEPTLTSEARPESDESPATPGMFVANYLPAFYHAVLLHGWGREADATDQLRRLPPHIVEGWILLGDDDRLATFRQTDPAGFERAARWHDAAREARWPGLRGPTDNPR